MTRRSVRAQGNAPGARDGFVSGPSTPRRSPKTAHASTVLRICDLGDTEVSDQARDFASISRRVAGLPNIPIVLGGDHSVSIPILQGQRARFRDRRLGLLWLDAHPDLCDEYTGSRLSHACVLRRGLECGIQPQDVCMVGLRSWEEQEIDLIEEGRLNVYTAADVAERGMMEGRGRRPQHPVALRSDTHFPRH